MSWTSKCREYIAMGLSEAEAVDLVARERVAMERGEEPPPLPPRVLEKLGQQQLFAPECWDDQEAA